MKIGLVLSGGGSRGFAHLGVLKALDEKNIKIDALSGTSAGSLAGVLYAAGYSPDYIFNYIVGKGIGKQLKFAFNRYGIFTLTNVEKLLIELIPHNSFEKLKIPMTVCTTDIEKSSVQYFSKGELAKPVMASCCLPGIFEPIRFNNQLLIDGGVINNLPIEPLQATCDFLIGVNVVPMEGNIKIKSAKDILMKSLYISISKSSTEKLNLCDMAIEPKELIKFDGLSISKAKEIFDVGYQAALQHIETNFSY